MFAASELPSAKTPGQDILFRGSADGRNPAELPPSRPFIRTTPTAAWAHFGPFSGSLRPLSLKQPNHARFGTDVGSSRNQCLRGGSKGCRFERRPLRRSTPGSNILVWLQAAIWIVL